MNRHLHLFLIWGGVALAAYLGYRWWENRSSSQTGLGSNLGSVGSLVGGSTGPDSGLNYYAGSTTVNLTQPVTSSAQVHPAVPVISVPVPRSAQGSPPGRAAVPAPPPGRFALKLPPSGPVWTGTPGPGINRPYGSHG